MKRVHARMHIILPVALAVFACGILMFVPEAATQFSALHVIGSFTIALSLAIRNKND